MATCIKIKQNFCISCENSVKHEKHCIFMRDKLPYILLYIWRGEAKIQQKNNLEVTAIVCQGFASKARKCKIP